jgi:3-hydroxybutyryl-CoA dehydrogenase
MAAITTVAVIGAGQMGAGIAQSLASAGYQTKLWDGSAEALKKGLAGITSRLEKGVEKGKLTAAERDQTLSRIKGVSTLSELAPAHLVIEAVVESFPVKEKLFQECAALFPPETIFASNTSSISITKLAATVPHPERVIGMHFMNPVPVMKLVEVIRGLQTSEETYSTALQVIHQLQKTPVTARRDFPGFIVNRVLVPMINEAVFALMEGIAEPEEIDTAMKLGTNQPMGPLELADFVGLDTCLYILQILHRELGDDKYRPCPLLIKYVEAGWYGRKSGRGFYQY